MTKATKLTDSEQVTEHINKQLFDQPRDQPDKKSKIFFDPGHWSIR